MREMLGVGVLLTLITVATVLGPMATVVIQYNDNLSELVLPHQVSEVLNSTVGTGQFEMPLFVSSAYDSLTRTVTLTVNFTNTFNYNLTLKSVTGNVECTLHNYTLGNLSLNGTVEIPAGESRLIPALCTLTANAEGHFETEHVGVTSIDVSVPNLTLNVNDITLQLTQNVELPNIPVE
jgi:hypothetical protein